METIDAIAAVVTIFAFLYLLIWGEHSVREILEARKNKREQARHGVGESELNKSARVFLSYSRKDLVFVERLAWDLKAAGLDVWYDLSGLEVGSRWGREIQNAITQSQYFVVVLSPNSVASDWVEREILYAGSLKRKVIPLVYSTCDMPLWLVDLQYIDVRGKKYNENFDQLLKALGVGSVKPASDAEKPAGLETAASFSQVEKEAPKRTKPAGQRGLKARKALAGVAALAILISAALIIWSPPPPPVCSIMSWLCPTPTPTPTTAPDSYPYDSTWAGTTSQNYRLIFTVTHNVITYVYTTIHTESGDARCPTGVHTLVDTPVYYPIENNTVSGTLESSQITLRAHGIFSSDTPASGSLFFALKGDCVSSVSVTWTATKQIGTPISTPTPVVTLDPSIQIALDQIESEAPLYDTSFGYWADFWQPIGEAAILDKKLIASSQDIQLDGIGMNFNLSDMFAVLFDFKSIGIRGGCTFSSTNRLYESDNFKAFDLYFRRDGFLELNRNELLRDNYPVTLSLDIFDFSNYRTAVIVVIGNKIAVLIDGQQVLTDFNPKPIVNYQDIRIGAYDSGECEFDNFMLWDLKDLTP